MTKQWILVANGSLARVFSRTNEGEPLVAMETMDFPEGRIKDRELQRDRQGHGSSDHSSAAVHFEPHTSQHKKLMHQFAGKLAKRLESGLAAGEYGVLWLIASSPFLGELRTALSEAVTDRLQWTHEADFTGLAVGALEIRLCELRKQVR